MEHKFEYSFDDEVVSKFCYDLDNKIIEVHFDGYYDLRKDAYIESPCIWILENWDDAKCKIGTEPNLSDLNKNIGIFSLILFMEYLDDKLLEMIVNTVDNKYLTLLFKNPKIDFIVKQTAK